MSIISFLLILLADSIFLWHMKELCFFSKTAVLTILFLSLAVSVSFAQAHEELERINSVFGSIGEIVVTATQIIFFATFLFFFWNVAMFIFKGTGEPEAKTRIAWSVVALFVLVSVWGFVALLNEVFLGDIRPVTPGESKTYNKPSSGEKPLNRRGR